jgi:hypothetical protein
VHSRPSAPAKLFIPYSAFKDIEVTALEPKTHIVCLYPHARMQTMLVDKSLPAAAVFCTAEQTPTCILCVYTCSMSINGVTWHSVPEEVQQPSLQQQNVQLQQQVVQLRLELAQALARAQAPKPDSEDKTAAVIAQLRREKAMLQMEIKALKREAAQWQKQKQQLTDIVIKNGLDIMDSAW